MPKEDQVAEVYKRLKDHAAGHTIPIRSNNRGSTPVDVPDDHNELLFPLLKSVAPQKNADVVTLSKRREGSHGENVFSMDLGGMSITGEEKEQ